MESDTRRVVMSCKKMEAIFAMRDVHSGFSGMHTAVLQYGKKSRSAAYEICVCSLGLSE